MKSSIRLWVVVVVVIILLAGVNSYAYEKFEINYSTDTAYLPYYFTDLTYRDRSREAPLNNMPIHYMQLTVDSVLKTMLVLFNNAAYNSDIMAQITTMDDIYHEAYDDRPVRGKITDVQKYHNQDIGHESFVLVADHQDSAFVYDYIPGKGQIRQLFLSTGKDQSGDGKWNPLTAIVLVEDYDFDNKTEVFLYTACARDFPLRELFCVELETMRLEWSLPIASVVHREMFYSCRDSVNPSVLFTTTNPSNGAEDEQFSDRYKYVVKLDNSGTVLLKKIICDNYTSLLFTRGMDDDTYYLGHTIPFDTTMRSFGPKDTILYVSKIDKDINIKQTMTVPLSHDLEMVYSYQNACPELLLISKKKELHFYSMDMDLKRKSNQTNLNYYQGRLKLPGQAAPSLVMVGEDGLDIYSESFERLASMKHIHPRQMNLVHSDSLGFAQTVLFTGANIYAYSQLKTRSWQEIFRIFLWNHRNKVYLTLSIIVMAFIMMTVNRFKTKKNLTVIASQKHKLEQTYSELKDAQYKLVQAERYKQAQEISAGFAHEIRNALFPVGMALKLNKTTTQPSTGDTQKLSEVVSVAFNKSLMLVDKFIEYTKITETVKIENISLDELLIEIVENKKELLQSVDFTFNTCTDDCIIQGNRDQLGMVFSNVIVNAVEAVAQHTHPVISVTAKRDNNSSKVTITIEDNGCGVKEEDIAKVSDPFFSTKPSKGSGLGLSFSKKVIEQLNGQFLFKSSYGERTTVSIILPIIQS